MSREDQGLNEKTIDFVGQIMDKSIGKIMDIAGEFYMPIWEISELNACVLWQHKLGFSVAMFDCRRIWL